MPFSVSRLGVRRLCLSQGRKEVACTNRRAALDAQPLVAPRPSHMLPPAVLVIKVGSLGWAEMAHGLRWVAEPCAFRFDVVSTCLGGLIPCVLNAGWNWPIASRQRCFWAGPHEARGGFGTGPFLPDSGLGSNRICASHST